MGLTSRRFAWLGLFLLGAVGSAFGACAIDENGTLAGDASLQDAPVIDVPPLDVAIETAPPPPPLSCEEAGTALDASCLGESIPQGWEPVAWQTGVTTCPTDAGFNAAFVQYTNAQIPNGACGCTPCNIAGAWTCTEQLAGGGNCGLDKASDTMSFCANINGHTSYSETVTRSGAPACTGGTEAGTNGYTADSVSLCLPSSCETDFCRLGQNGYRLCIYNPNATDGVCPNSTFSVPTVIGGAVAFACDPCQACTLANSDAGCGAGTVTAFDASDCTGPVLGSSSTNGTCAATGSNYGSLYWEAGATPMPSCVGGQNVTTGQISLVNKGTICCTN